MPVFRWVGMILLVAGFAACGVGSRAEDAVAKQAAATWAEGAVSSVGSYTRPVDLVGDGVSPFKSRQVGSMPVARSVQLGELVQSKSIQAARPGVRQIGVARKVAETADTAALASMLQWQLSSGGGQRAAISFGSSGAKGMRLGVLVDQVPPSARLRVYTQNDETAFEISGSEITAVIQRNVSAGEDGAAAHTYWMPNMGTDEVTLELELLPGMDAGSLRIAVPEVSHFTTSTADQDFAELAKVGESGSCEVDVSCKSQYGETSNSVALMEFVEGGYSYICTGTLLNDATSSGTPYFLSARHCISTQSTASTLMTTWFYRSQSCNSSTVNPAVKTLQGGATLLYTSAATDVAFLRLNGAPPVGATYAGWDVAAPSNPATSLAGVHHPRGDLQKVSEGTLAGFSNCTDISGSSGFSCTPTVGANSGSYLRVLWTSGSTEGGSSGSGLFLKKADGKLYLVGQLAGGSSSCAALSSNDYYGRFDIAYAAALSQWLSPSAPVETRQAVYRFYNIKTGTHFFTMSQAERDYVVAAYPAFQYEGAAFYAYGNSLSGQMVPVFRFFNTMTGAHFYTSSADERDAVLRNWPQFNYEGVSWYAQAAAGGSATPMYRFFNTKTSTHFYTINLAERDFVLQNYYEYQYENIAYYAWSEP